LTYVLSSTTTKFYYFRQYAPHVYVDIVRPENGQHDRNLKQLIKLCCGWWQYPCQFLKDINYCIFQSVFYLKTLSRTDLVSSMLRITFKKFTTIYIWGWKLRTKWIIKLTCRKLQHVIFRCCNFRWPEIFWSTSNANVRGAISYSAASSGNWTTISQTSTGYPGHFSTP
jgi:hypothetical protein